MIRAAAVVAAVLVLGVTVPAAASPGHAAGHRCTETDHFVAQYGNQPNWAEAEWTVNTCGWYIRGFAHCQSGRNYILNTGGWVTPDGKYSRADCTTGYPVLAGGGYDYKSCSSCSYTRVWKFGHVKEAAGRMPG